MLIAQISDLHYRQDGVRLFGYVDVHTAAQHAVDRLNAHHPKIDAVLVTGDLVNDGEAADYAALKAVLDGLDAPYAVITGNHDRRALLAGAFPAEGAADVENAYCWARDFGPIHVIGLDTLVEGEHLGDLGAAQFYWLESALEASRGQPTLVCLHHPPFVTGIGFMDAFPYTDGAALEDLVSRFDHVEAVLAGHIHRVMHRRFGGTIAMVGPGTAHQVVLDLTPEKKPRWIMEPAGCLLHDWREDTGLVSHALWFADYRAEAPFHSHHGSVPVQG